MTKEEQIIRDLLDWDSSPDTWQERTPSEIALMLEIKNTSAVGKALRNMGYEKTRDSSTPKRYRRLDGSFRYTVPARRVIPTTEKTYTTIDVMRLIQSAVDDELYELDVEDHRIAYEIEHCIFKALTKDSFLEVGK